MKFLRDLVSRGPDEPGRLLGVGLGAGLAGALFLTLRHRLRRPDVARLPEAMSPAFFRTRVCGTEFGQMVYHESRPAGTAVAAGAVAPTLVFLHSIGVGMSSYEWSKVYPHFAPRHRVLAPDWIGFGRASVRCVRPERMAKCGHWQGSSGGLAPTVDRWLPSPRGRGPASPC